MSEKVREIIEYYSENHCVDFKKEQYQLGNDNKKFEFLKDISAMANHPFNGDKYIIIGVEAKNGVATNFKNIINLIDQAKYQQYLNEYIEPQINLEYRPIEFDGYQLAYFRIFENNDRPYLFKKDVQAINDDNKHRTIYRAGDGLIRVGSETEKMVRSDFEKIYNNKLKQKDRKADLIITPVITDYKECTMPEEVKFKIFDINIQNLSNRSIDFDIELRIYKSNHFKIITNTAFEGFMKKENSNYIPFTKAVIPNLHIANEETEDYFIFRRTKLRNMKTAASLLQNETENDIFSNEILILHKEKGSIVVDITIRSDDFTDGALIQRFEVNI